jgi:prephenate dehydrogenase
VRPRAAAIVGLGLVGGSLARALTRAGYRVVGVDRPPVIRRALRARAIAAGDSLEGAARETGLVVLAAPPSANRRLLARLARSGPTSLVVTDVTSVKAPICREAARLGVRGFVGGHPMAGTERSGFAASSARLFQGRPWILVTDGASPGAVSRVRALVRAVGARPVVMTAAEHDRTMAFLSHLPQVMAWALDEAVRGDRVAARHRAAAGPAFADMTRLARSPRPLWRQILTENRTEVARALRALRGALHRGSR